MALNNSEAALFLQSSREVINLLSIYQNKSIKSYRTGFTGRWQDTVTNIQAAQECIDAL